MSARPARAAASPSCTRMPSAAPVPSSRSPCARWIASRATTGVPVSASHAAIWPRSASLAAAAAAGSAVRAIASRRVAIASTCRPAAACSSASRSSMRGSQGWPRQLCRSPARAVAAAAGSRDPASARTDVSRNRARVAMSPSPAAAAAAKAASASRNRPSRASAIPSSRRRRAPSVAGKADPGELPEQRPGLARVAMIQERGGQLEAQAAPQRVGIGLRQATGALPLLCRQRPAGAQGGSIGAPQGDLRVRVERMVEQTGQGRIGPAGERLRSTRQGDPRRPHRPGGSRAELPVVDQLERGARLRAERVRQIEPGQFEARPRPLRAGKAAQLVQQARPGQLPPGGVQGGQAGELECARQGRLRRRQRRGGCGHDRFRRVRVPVVRFRGGCRRLLLHGARRGLGYRYGLLRGDRRQPQPAGPGNGQPPVRHGGAHAVGQRPPHQAL